MPRFRRFIPLAALAGVALLSTGCLRAPVIPPTGFLFTDIQAPLDHDFDETRVLNQGVTTLSGKSRSISILGLVAVGDASANAAARDGNLAVIQSADYKYKNVLGVYQEYVTVVYGY